MLEFFSTATTAILGIIGVFSGAQVVQAAAYAPAVVEYAINQIYKENSDEKLKKEVRAVLEETAKRTIKCLEKNNKHLAKKLMEISYVVPTIDQCMILSLSELNSMLKNILNQNKIEIDGIDDLDIKYINQEYIRQLKKVLVQHETVCALFLLNSYETSDKRIEQLEKAFANLTKRTQISNKRTLSDDTKFYCLRFEEPLFLHSHLPKDRQICIKDLYVNPYGAELRESSIFFKSEKPKTVFQLIHDFLHYSIDDSSNLPIDIMFINGLPALGKSSMISKMAWEYKNNEIGDLLNNRSLLVIRLRDLLEKRNYLNVQSPFSDYIFYLLNIDIENFSREEVEKINQYLFKNKVLVLDGFDELCMVDDLLGDVSKSIYFSNMYNSLKRMNCNCKIIITSRPEYIKYRSLEFPKYVIELKSFDKANRDEWIGKYTERESVNEEIVKIIKGNHSSDIENILQIPLVLYMITARKVLLSENENIWSIYYQIFHEQLFKRNYENFEPHQINKYEKMLYPLVANISYAIMEEEHLFISTEKLLTRHDIRKIIDEFIVKNDNKIVNLNEILDECVVLCCYFYARETQSNGRIIEFFHNDIRDFFLCEYFWNSLEEIYKNIPTNRDEIEAHFISEFQKMFQFAKYMMNQSIEGVPNNISLKFLKAKLDYYKAQGKNPYFIEFESKHRFFSQFFGKMLQTGIIYEYHYNGKENVINLMVNIYSAVLELYQVIYSVILKKGERLPISDNEFKIQIGTSFIFNLLFIRSNTTNYRNLEFDNILISTKVNKRDFRNSSFRNCLMRYAVFDESNLCNVDFSNADLGCADFRNAIIDENTCFKNCNCKGTKVRRNQVYLFKKYGILEDDLDIYE